MPIYEYICKQCGTKNEFVENLGPGRIVSKKCRNCGGVRLKKTVSSFVYTPEVSLEDLGVKIVRQPPAPQPGGANMEVPRMDGPPPGGCPYCIENKPEDTNSSDPAKHPSAQKTGPTKKQSKNR